jgi:hypothetical protein
MFKVNIHVVDSQNACNGEMRTCTCMYVHVCVHMHALMAFILGKSLLSF